MARIKIALPEKVLFSTNIPVRITDINYGNHIGNQVVLELAHEARLQYLHHLGYASETAIEGVGWIVADAGIQFVAQGYYGMVLEVEIQVGEISKRSFDLYYHIKESQGKATIAKVKTGMVCFDYEENKPVNIPDKLRAALEG